MEPPIITDPPDMPHRQEPSSLLLELTRSMDRMTAAIDKVGQDVRGGIRLLGLALLIIAALSGVKIVQDDAPLSPILSLITGTR